MSTTILVVDDDQEIIDILKLLLNLEKYNVITASNGITGLSLAPGVQS
ncbi:hypothetical protein [Seleniivibrio woodruffii]|nr:hypothetical protein [Seleniivibrio woodruffii]